MKKVKMRILVAVLTMCMIFSGFHMVTYAGSDTWEDQHDGVYYTAHLGCTSKNAYASLSRGEAILMQVGLLIDGTENSNLRKGFNAYIESKPENTTYKRISTSAGEGRYVSNATGTYYFKGKLMRTLYTSP